MDSKERLRQKLAKMRGEEAPVVEEKPKDAATPKKKQPPPKQELPVEAIEPNPWNPNQMDKGQMRKLRNGISVLIQQGVQPPPIVVREFGKGYQIIDGYHRWLTYKDLKQATIPAHVVNVDEATARILTDTLNYLRGSPDEEKYSEFISTLVVEHKRTLDDLAEFLPESKDELIDILEQSNAGIRALLAIDESTKNEKEKVETDDDIWVDLAFRVSKSQADVIEREISRIESTLDGKSRRGRALEFMAATSAATPLPDEAPPKKKAKKAKAEA